MLQALTDTATGVGSAINTGLQSSVQPSNLVTEFVSLLPWIGGMVLVAFVIYEARKLGKGASKGKVRY